MSGTAMDLDLREVEQGQTHLDLSVEGSAVGLTRSELILKGPLDLSLDLDRRGDEIWVRGRVHTVAVQQCSRCLTEFDQNLDFDFDVFCAKLRSPRTMSPIELDEEDGGVHFHDGRVLSIDGEIREAVLLSLPMRPLCRESCAGLCPRCGEDRNMGPCRCERAPAP